MGSHADTCQSWRSPGKSLQRWESRSCYPHTPALHPSSLHPGPVSSAPVGQSDSFLSTGHVRALLCLGFTKCHSSCNSHILHFWKNTQTRKLPTLCFTKFPLCPLKFVSDFYFSLWLVIHLFPLQCKGNVCSFGPSEFWDGTCGTPKRSPQFHPPVLQLPMVPVRRPLLEHWIRNSKSKSKKLFYSIAWKSNIYGFTVHGHLVAIASFHQTHRASVGLSQRIAHS